MSQDPVSVLLCFWDSAEGAKMSKARRIFTALLLGSVIAVLVGCPTSTSIEKINKDPGKYAGREVTIGGKASTSFGALGNGIYQLDDGTGRMWVLSQGFGVPGDGAKVAVTGLIQQGVSFGGRSFAVIMKQTKARH